MSDPYELVKFYGLRDTYRHTQTHIHTHTDRGTQAKTWTFGRQFEGVSDIIMVLAGPEVLMKVAMLVVGVAMAKKVMNVMIWDAVIENSGVGARISSDPLIYLVYI